MIPTLTPITAQVQLPKLYVLCRAYAARLLAEAAFDAHPTPETEKAATQAYIAMVTAAAAYDPHSLRSASISEWVEAECAKHRSVSQ